MDPQCALDLIHSLGIHPDDRAAALLDLAAWIAGGGFLPSPDDLHDYTQELEDAYREQGLLEVFASLRTAIYYGDLSGLEGCGFRVVR
jgi:hypothetical protein